MRRILKSLAVILGVGVTAYAAWVYSGPLASETGLAYSKNYTLNLANTRVSSLSMLAVYSTTTFSNSTFTDGTQSTTSITVNSLTNLTGKQGTNSITVSTTGALSGATITIGGTTLTEGLQWWTQTSTNSVATSIKQAINAFTPTFTATIGAQTNKVSISCTSSGTWCNNAGLSVSVSSLTVGSALFTGGVDNSVIAINNLTLIQGRDWTAASTSSGTAKAISDAIMANSGTSAIVSSTWSMIATSSIGVVAATSTIVGTAGNYSLFSSTQPALTLAGSVTTNSIGQGTSAMTGGTNSKYTINQSSITATSHHFTTALPLLYSGTPAIGGLTTGTTYYAISVDANTLGLASSSANAQAGTAITLTSSSTQTTAHTYTLAPLAFTGTPSFKWQGSNDGSNFVDVNTSSITFASPYAASSMLWDFGPVGYSYMRLAVIGPTTGGMALTVTGDGRTNQ